MKLACALLLLAPSLAAARPITAGVGLGLTEGKQDSSYGSNETLEVFGRIGITPRVAGQAELQRIQTGDPSVDVRTISVLLAVDLGNGGRVMPMIIAGVGYDDASTTYGTETTGHHIEGGFALEYRADGGLTIGGDARMGGRSIDSDMSIQPLTNVVGDYYSPSTLHAGEYRSVRVYAGVRF